MCLLEAEAAIVGLRVINDWRRAGIPEEIFRIIVNETYDGIYAIAGDWALRILGSRFSLLLLLVAIQLSLFSPLLKYDDKKCPHMEWEDIQPCWRFVNILWAMSRMSLPDDPIGEFQALCEGLAKKLSWLSPPWDHAAEFCSKDFSGVENPLARDLQERHIAFCRHAVKGGFVSPAAAPPELLKATGPWIICNNGEGLIHSAPQWMDSSLVLPTVLRYLLLEDARSSPSLARSQEIHNAMWQYKFRLHEGSKEQRDREFESYVGATLRFAFSEIE